MFSSRRQILASAVKLWPRPWLGIIKMDAEIKKLISDLII